MTLEKYIDKKGLELSFNGSKQTIFGGVLLSLGILFILYDIGVAPILSASWFFLAMTVMVLRINDAYQYHKSKNYRIY